MSGLGFKLDPLLVQIDSLPHFYATSSSPLLSLSSCLPALFPASPTQRCFFRPSPSLRPSVPPSLPALLLMPAVRLPFRSNGFLSLNWPAGGREGRREGGRGASLFPSFPKEIMREYWTGRKRWRERRGEERRGEDCNRRTEQRGRGADSADPTV